MFDAMLTNNYCDFYIYKIFDKYLYNQSAKHALHF